MTIIVVNSTGTAVVAPNPTALAQAALARAAFEASVVSTQ